MVRWSKKDVQTLLKSINGYNSYTSTSRDIFRGKFTPTECITKMEELSNKPWTEVDLKQLERMEDLIYSNPAEASMLLLRPIKSLQEKHWTVRRGRRQPFFQILDTKVDDKHPVAVKKSSVLCGLENEREQLKSLLADTSNDRIIIVGPKNSGKSALLHAVADELALKVEPIVWSTENKESKRNYLRDVFARKSNTTVFMVDDATLDHLGYDLMKLAVRKHRLVACVSFPMSIERSILRLFNKRIIISLPNAMTRSIMLKDIMLDKAIELSPEVDLEVWGKLTFSFSYMELQMLCEAAYAVSLRGLEEDKDVSHCDLKPVSQADIVAACDKISPAASLSYLESLKDSCEAIDGE